MESMIIGALSNIFLSIISNCLYEHIDKEDLEFKVTNVYEDAYEKFMIKHEGNTQIEEFFEKQENIDNLIECFKYKGKEIDSSTFNNENSLDDNIIKDFISELKQAIKNDETLGRLLEEREHINQQNCMQKKIDEINDKVDNLVKNKNDDFVVTTYDVPRPKYYFTGREDIIDEMKQYVNNTGQSIVINGMGGIGKTELSKYLYDEYMREHKNTKLCSIDYIGYIPYEDSIDKALIENLKFKKSGEYGTDILEAWSKLRSIANNNRLLLFVDDIPNIKKDNSLNKLMNINASIIITSRECNIDECKTIYLEPLSIDICIIIFKKIYGSVKEDELELLQEIIENRIGNHTLTIELLAKTSKKKGWNIKKLNENLVKYNFNIKIIFNSGNNKSLLMEYEKLFNISNLSKEEVNILEAFSLFPNIELDGQYCESILSEDANIEVGDEVTLYELYSKGWLQKNDDKYSMHPVIAETIYNMKKPSIESHKFLIKNCIKQTTVDDKKTFIDCMKYLTVIKPIANRINFNNNILEKSELNLNIANILKDMGEYNESILYLKDILKENLLIDNSIKVEVERSIGTVYSVWGKYKESYYYINQAYNDMLGWEIYTQKDELELSRICRELGRLNNIYSGENLYALLYYKKAANIQRRILGNSNNEIALTYSNIGGLLKECGKAKKAIYWFKKVLNIYATNLKSNDPKIAIVYNNLGISYDDMDDFDNAIKYLKMSLDIRQEIYGDDHILTARVYSNIGSAYARRDKLGEANKYLNKAFIIRREKLGMETRETGITCLNIADVKEREEKYKEALDFYNKAKQSFLAALPKEHNLNILVEEKIKYVSSKLE